MNRIENVPAGSVGSPTANCLSADNDGIGAESGQDPNALGKMLTGGSRRRALIFAFVSFFLVQSSLGQRRSGTGKPAAQTPQAIARRAMGSLVSITTYRSDLETPIGYGSGFCIARDPLKRGGVLIATNYHVLKGTSAARVRPITVKGSAGDSADIAFVDALHDIAILSVAVERTPLTLSTRSPVVGDAIYVMGNPERLEGSFSTGIVSAVRSKPTPEIQITAPISPGSSGGPVLNTAGQVVGVTKATFWEGQNLNFAVPATILNVALAAFLADPDTSIRQGFEVISKDRSPDWKPVSQDPEPAFYYDTGSITDDGKGHRSMWILSQAKTANIEYGAEYLMAFDCSHGWQTVIRYRNPDGEVKDTGASQWSIVKDRTFFEIACRK